MLNKSVQLRLAQVQKEENIDHQGFADQEKSSSRVLEISRLQQEVNTSLCIAWH